MHLKHIEANFLRYVKKNTDDFFYLVNNMNVRHNNCDSSDKNRYNYEAVLERSYMESIIIGVAGVLATILAPILTPYVTSLKMKGESCFYSFITLSEEKIVKRARAKSIVLFLVIVLTYIVAIINSVFPFLPVSSDVSVSMQIAGTIVIIVIVVLQVFFGIIFPYFNNKYFEKKIKDSKRDLINIGKNVDVIAIYVFVFFFILYLIIEKFVDVTVIVPYVFFLVSLGIDAVLYSYVSLYVKIRRWYYVNSISIRIKQNGRVYDNIFNFKIDNRLYSFMVEIDEKLLRIEVPIDEVASIEYEIDAKTSFLDNWNKSNSDNIDKEKQKKGIDKETF